MLNAWFGIENREHRSEYANFDEDNYPIVATMWYAPTTDCSFTLGYAFMNNWINPDYSWEA